MRFTSSVVLVTAASAAMMHSLRLKPNQLSHQSLPLLLLSLAEISAIQHLDQLISLADTTLLGIACKETIASSSMLVERLNRMLLLWRKKKQCLVLTLEFRRSLPSFLLDEIIDLASRDLCSHLLILAEISLLQLS